MPEPGLVHDLDEPTYHADRTALSQSGMKLILQSPAHFRWAMDHPSEPSKAFDHGSAAHARVLGVGQEIVVIQRRITDRKGNLIEVIDAPDLRSTSAQDHAKEIRQSNRIPLLAKDFAIVLEMESKLREHRLAMELLSEGEPEVSVYGQDSVTGVWMRGRYDWLGAKVIVDYKTADSSDPDVFVRKAVDYGYDLQAATYLDLAAIIGHTASAFAHIVQEKRPPYVVSVVVLPAELIERGRVLKHRALQRYRDCVEADKWPGYLPDDEFATPAAPPWALRDLEDLE